MMFWPDRHRRLRNQLSAYIDGALDLAAARRLEAHLGECRGCRREMEQLRSTVAALQELPEARVPRSFTLSPERAAAPRPSTPAAPLAFGARIAVAGVAVALAAVLVVDLGDLGRDGAPAEVSAPQSTDELQAYDRGLEAEGHAATGGEAPEAAGGVAPEPNETPAAPEADGQDAADQSMREPAAAETAAAGPKEVEAPAAAPSGDGLDALTVAEIGLAAALGVLIVGSLALALAGRKR